MISAAMSGMLVLAVSCSIDPIGGSAGVDVPEVPSKIINRQNDPVQGSLIVRLADLSQYFSLEQRLGESGIEMKPVFKGLEAPVTKAGTPEADLACWYELKFSESADLDSLASVVAGYEEVGRVQFNNRLKIASDGRSYQRSGAGQTVALQERWQRGLCPNGGPRCGHKRRGCLETRDRTSGSGCRDNRPWCPVRPS